MVPVPGSCAHMASRGMGPLRYGIDGRLLTACHGAAVEYHLHRDRSSAKFTLSVSHSRQGSSSP